MRRCTQVFVCVVTVVLAAGLSFAGSGGVLTPSLALETGTTWLEADDQILLRFELSNDSRETLLVLRWQTPINGIEHNILLVERDGEAVTYTGILAKRAEPRPEDYVEIAPGETLSVVFDPSATYDMAVTGEYTVRYRTALQHIQTVTATKSMDPVADWVEVESNVVDFHLEGVRQSWQEFRYKGVDCDKHPNHPHCQGGGGGGGGGGGTVEFVACDSRQQSKALGAVDDAKIISRAAHTDLVGGSPIYTTWFGTYTSSRYSKVTGNFDAIADAFESQTVTINCSDANLPYYAYVYPSHPYEIYVCKYFFRAPAMGRDSKAGTLVHEMSHFNVTAGTDDHVYGEANALWLAATYPNLAVENADNHEYFAEDQ